MPKKKINIEEQYIPEFDIDLVYGTPDSVKIKARTIVSYGDFIAAVDSVVDTAFKKGYSSANVPYLFNSALFHLFTDFSSFECDDVMQAVYVNKLDRAIYNVSPMAIAFRDAVREGIEYRKNRSNLDILLERVNSIDVKKLEKVLTNLSSIKLTKDDLTKAIIEATKE